MISSLQLPGKSPGNSVKDERSWNSWQTFWSALSFFPLECSTSGVLPLIHKGSSARCSYPVSQTSPATHWALLSTCSRCATGMTASCRDTSADTMGCFSPLANTGMSLYLLPSTANNCSSKLCDYLIWRAQFHFLLQPFPSPKTPGLTWNEKTPPRWTWQPPTFQSQPEVQLLMEPRLSAPDLPDPTKVTEMEKHLPHLLSWISTSSMHPPNH